MNITSKRLLQLTFICTIISQCCVRTEVFTALVEMEELLETEAVLINNLDKYIQIHQQKLDFLTRKVNEFSREHNEASADVTSYLSNPINAYLLTKRLTTDWKEVESLMSYDVGAEFLANVTNHRSILKFPTDEDLNGAAVALMRLQDTYNLETSSVARGELNGIQYSTQMSANDCFEMGRQSYINSDFYHTVLWMREAMDRLIAEANKTETTRADILEYLAFSTYKTGNTILALDMTNELLELRPDHERAIGNKVFYEKELSVRQDVKKTDKKMRGDTGSTDVLEEEIVPIRTKSIRSPSVYDSPERRLYEMLCRNEIAPSPLKQAALRCRYVANNSPFLKIAPLKVEEAHHNPHIYIYHDVMYDNEIELIQRLAKPRFRRATVQNHKTGELEVAHYRISKSAWLRDEEDRIIKNVGLRVQDMSGLTVQTAEELQVVNYGIGGHYEPHFDFARKEETNAFVSLGTGNRIATALFYMSDVPQGGATVFPNIRTALWPKKGTAAFWMNLHKDGEGDYLTRHAACPVLTGTKWVSNKWLHERGQEFLRPCGLTPDHPPSD